MPQENATEDKPLQIGVNFMIYNSATNSIIRHPKSETRYPFPINNPIALLKWEAVALFSLHKLRLWVQVHKIGIDTPLQKGGWGCISCDSCWTQKRFSELDPEGPIDVMIETASNGKWEWEGSVCPEDSKTETEADPKWEATTQRSNPNPHIHSGNHRATQYTQHESVSDTQWIDMDSDPDLRRAIAESLKTNSQDFYVETESWLSPKKLYLPKSEAEALWAKLHAGEKEETSQDEAEVAQDAGEGYE